MSWNPSASITGTTSAKALLLVSAFAVMAQPRGRISGTIIPPAANLVVIATNQVTSKVTTATISGDGRYSLRVRPGAYRLSVARPYRAKFDNAKNYGEHALIREDSLENVIVGEAKETKVDFAVEKMEAKPVVSIPGRKPLGAAGNTSVESAPLTQSDR